MHRFTLTHDLLVAAAARGGGGAAELAALAVWLRLSAGRLLTWNRAYNVKPREISAAQAWPARPARRRRRRALACMAPVLFPFPSYCNLRRLTCPGCPAARGAPRARAASVSSRGRALSLSRVPRHVAGSRRWPAAGARRRPRAAARAPPQDRLTARLAALVEAAPAARDAALLAMAAVGRGGVGDAGQRIRDEILAIQQRNAAKARLVGERVRVGYPASATTSAPRLRAPACRACMPGRIHWRCMPDLV